MKNSLPIIFCILLITSCCHKPLCLPHHHHAPLNPPKILRENPVEIQVRGAVYVDEEY